MDTTKLEQACELLAQAAKLITDHVNEGKDAGYRADLIDLRNDVQASHRILSLWA